MDFPLVDAVLANVPDQVSSVACGISGLLVAVQEPDMKYTEFDTLSTLPGMGAPVDRRERKPSRPSAAAPTKEALADLLAAARTEARVEPEAPPQMPAASIKKAFKPVHEEKAQQQSLRDVFTFLAGKQESPRSVSNLSDIFR